MLAPAMREFTMGAFLQIKHMELANYGVPDPKTVCDLFLL